MFTKQELNNLLIFMDRVSTKGIEENKVYCDLVGKIVGIVNTPEEDKTE